MKLVITRGLVVALILGALLGITVKAVFLGGFGVHSLVNIP